MGFAAAPIAGAGNAALAALVLEVIGDLSSPDFDPNVDGRNASAVTVPGEADGQWRNAADDIRTAVRDRLIAQGLTPPEGLTLRQSRDGSTVTFYYGAPLEKTKPEHVGPKGSTGKVSTTKTAEGDAA